MLSCKKNHLARCCFTKARSRTCNNYVTKINITRQAEQVRSKEEFRQDSTLAVNVNNIVSHHMKKIIKHEQTCQSLLNTRKLVRDIDNHTADKDCNTHDVIRISVSCQTIFKKFSNGWPQTCTPNTKDTEVQTVTRIGSVQQSMEGNADQGNEDLQRLPVEGTQSSQIETYTVEDDFTRQTEEQCVDPMKGLDTFLVEIGYGKYRDYPEISSKKGIWVIWFIKGYKEDIGHDVQRLIDAFML